MVVAERAAQADVELRVGRDLLVPARVRERGDDVAQREVERRQVRRRVFEQAARLVGLLGADAPLAVLAALAVLRRIVAQIVEIDDEPTLAGVEHPLDLVLVIERARLRRQRDRGGRGRA